MLDTEWRDDRIKSAIKLLNEALTFEEEAEKLESTIRTLRNNARRLKHQANLRMIEARDYTSSKQGLK